MGELGDRHHRRNRRGHHRETYAHHYDVTAPGIVVTAGALWPWEISPAPDAGVADMES